MNHLKTVAVIGCIMIGVESRLSAGGNAPAPRPVTPRSVPLRLVPEVQVDEFSCGFHALSAIYRSHGVDPEEADLRYRLGTSARAIPFIKDSTGTLQPDLFRVLKQDGFEAETLRLSKRTTKDALIEHLEGGLYALALTQTENAGGLHWVVFTDYARGQVTVADSLEPELQRQDLGELIEGNLLSVTLITPGTPDPDASFAAAT